MPIIRGLDQVFADFDARQRQLPGSRNQPLQKFVVITDSVVFAADTITATVTATTAYQWVVATSTTVEGVWNEQGEWA